MTKYTKQVEISNDVQRAMQCAFTARLDRIAVEAKLKQARSWELECVQKFTAAIVAFREANKENPDSAVTMLNVMSDTLETQLKLVKS